MVELVLGEDDYIYLNLTSKDLFGMFKDHTDVDIFNDRVRRALITNDCKFLYISLKDILVCSFVTCEKFKRLSFGPKELWKNALFSKSETLYRILDIFLSTKTITPAVMKQVIIDDGQIHTFDFRNFRTVVSSKQFEREMRL